MCVCECFDIAYLFIDCLFHSFFLNFQFYILGCNEFFVGHIDTENTKNCRQISVNLLKVRRKESYSNLNHLLTSVLINSERDSHRIRDVVQNLGFRHYMLCGSLKSFQKVVPIKTTSSIGKWYFQSCNKFGVSMPMNLPKFDFIKE